MPTALARLHRMKTGALIAAAVQLGARCGRTAHRRRSVVRSMTTPRAAGLAFQVVDDILDVEGSAASLGKTAGKDAAQNKATFVTLLGLARREAARAGLRDARARCAGAVGRGRDAPARARRLDRAAQPLMKRAARTLHPMRTTDAAGVGVPGASAAGISSLWQTRTR